LQLTGQLIGFKRGKTMTLIHNMDRTIPASGISRQDIELYEGMVKATALNNNMMKHCARSRLLVKKSMAVLDAANKNLRQEMDNHADFSRVALVKAFEKYNALENIVAQVSSELEILIHDFEKKAREQEILEQQLSMALQLFNLTRYNAFHDLLTGLPNRALFSDRLEHAFAQAQRHKCRLAVLFIDLDGFKRINDLYGHDVGDAVLLTVAKRLRNSTRSNDTVCRYGGDEFLYLLPEIQNVETVDMICAKLIKMIGLPCNINKPDCHISCRVDASIGTAIYPNEGDSTESLITLADRAMYAAKQKKHEKLSKL